MNARHVRQEFRVIVHRFIRHPEHDFQLLQTRIRVWAWIRAHLHIWRHPFRSVTVYTVNVPKWKE